MVWTHEVNCNDFPPLSATEASWTQEGCKALFTWSGVLTSFGSNCSLESTWNRYISRAALSTGNAIDEWRADHCWTKQHSDLHHQEKWDLEIPLNFMLIQTKQKISVNCGNCKEGSGNSCKFLRWFGDCSTFFLIFQCAICICLIMLCYLHCVFPLECHAFWERTLVGEWTTVVLKWNATDKIWDFLTTDVVIWMN